MNIVTYNRLPQIDKAFSKILTENGYVDMSSAPFLGQIINTIKEAAKGPYSELYELSNNIDLGRSTGSFLDRWGVFHNQPRATTSYASDLSLSNTEIYLSNNITAGEITIDGGDLPIPAGTIISDENNDYIVRTIDDVVISSNRNSVFVRVVAENEGEVTIYPGYLTKVNLDLKTIPQVMSSSLGKYQLKARNAKAISGGTIYPDDETYRYTLLKTAESKNLSNESKIETAIKLEDISYMVVSKFRGGITVFVDSVDISSHQAIVIRLQNYIDNIINFGMPVYCFSPVISKIIPTISLSLKNNDNLNQTQNEFKDQLVDIITNTRMGQNVDLKNIITTIAGSIPNIDKALIADLKMNGRKMLNYSIETRFNERLILNKEDIVIR